MKKTKVLKFQRGSKTPWKKTMTDVLRRWQLYLMVLPALIYLIMFCYKPMVGIIIAFKDFKLKAGIWGSEWVGLKNFQRLFGSYWFPIMLKNTVTLSGLSILIGFPLPIIIALMVNEIENQKRKKTFQIISYAPHFVSVVVVSTMITMFLSPSTGVINRVITSLGFESVNWLQSSAAFKWIYIISELWSETGWSALIYYSALSAVDKELHEAAEIDGANRLKRIIHINLPTILPTIVIMFILKCGQILSVGYEKVYLLQNATNIMGSEVISTYVYKMGLENNEFSFSTAADLFNAIVNCFFLTVVNRVSKRVSGSGLW